MKVNTHSSGAARRLCGLLLLGLLLAGCARAAPPPEQSEPADRPWVRLLPASGPPGTAVEITGYLPDAPEPAVATHDASLQHAWVCWDGCDKGLLAESVPVAWSQDRPGHFTMRFTVPAVPWLAAGGPHPVQPGTYEVGVRCVGGARGCGALLAPQSAAQFRLTGEAPASCTGGPCTPRLRFTPPAAPPGAAVQVEGWAPLGFSPASPAGASSPAGLAGYDLLLGAPDGRAPLLGHLTQAPDGALSGSMRLSPWLTDPPLSPGTYNVILQAPNPPYATQPLRLAEVPFQVTAGTPWTELPPLRPLLTQEGTRLLEPGLAVSADGRQVAYCRAGSIRLSGDGSYTWRDVAVAGAVAVAAATDYPLFPAGGKPLCTEVLTGPGQPESIFATFDAAHKPYGAPPLFRTGYYTRDGGHTWQAVPPPTGAASHTFGGFRRQGAAILALFSRVNPSLHPLAMDFFVTATADGGATWGTGALACPEQGPCATFGPAPAERGACAMHEYNQPLLLLTGAGGSPDWPRWINACHGGELAAVSATDAALLSRWDRFPLYLSHDRAATWTPVALPPLPGSMVAGYNAFPGLTLLPDGALLAAGSGGWYRLPSGAGQWCALSANLVPPGVRSLQGAGGRLWWLQGEGAAITMGSAPLAALTCGG